MSSCHHDTLLVTGHDKCVMVGGSQVWDQVFATGIRSHHERHVQCLEPPATDLETDTTRRREQRKDSLLVQQGRALFEDSPIFFASTRSDHCPNDVPIN